MKSALAATDKQPLITFTDDDFRGIVKNHDEPMVIWAIITNADIGRILIDQWSSIDILSYEAFQKKMFCDANLLPHDTTLITFIGDRITPDVTWRGDLLWKAKATLKQSQQDSY